MTAKRRCFYIFCFVPCNKVCILWVCAMFFCKNLWNVTDPRAEPNTTIGKSFSCHQSKSTIQEFKYRLKLFAVEELSALNPEGRISKYFPPKFDFTFKVECSVKHSKRNFYPTVHKFVIGQSRFQQWSIHFRFPLFPFQRFIIQVWVHPRALWQLTLINSRIFIDNDWWRFMYQILLLILKLFWADTGIQGNHGRPLM